MVDRETLRQAVGAATADLIARLHEAENCFANLADNPSDGMMERAEVCCRAAEAIAIAAKHEAAQHAELTRLRRYEAAITNHLCPHDAADWLACAGGHVIACTVCDSDTPREHQLMERLDRAEAKRDRLRAVVAELVRVHDSDGELGVLDFELDEALTAARAALTDGESQ